MAEHGGVIHDLGYRHYQGPRESDAAIFASLYRISVRHVFGVGRSGRSKLLPNALLVLNLVPAIVMVGILAMVDTDAFLSEPLDYLNSTQVLTSVFVASQAPVLFSRDLRSRAIVLYLARPLSSTGYVLARALGLLTSVCTFMLAPLLILQLGAFFGNGDAGGYALDLLKALPFLLLLGCLLCAIAGTISAYALRRGFAVVGTIVVTVVGTGLINGLKEASHYNDFPTVGSIAGLFSPWTLVGGLADGLHAGLEVTTPPEGPGWVLLYLAVAVLVLLGCAALVVRRFATAGRR